VSDLWRVLKIGDRVRLVEWPEEIHEDRLHPETRDLYRWLIDTRGILAVVKIDDLGLPHGKIHRVVDCEDLCEFLLLNHSGGLEIVAET
jgi:hypothetical protein